MANLPLCSGDFNGITWNGNCSEDIGSRNPLGKTVFGRVRNLLVTRRIDVKILKRFPKYFILSIVIYALETWMIRNREKSIWKASKFGCG